MSILLEIEFIFFSYYSPRNKGQLKTAVTITLSMSSSYRSFIVYLITFSISFKALLPFFLAVIMIDIIEA